MTSSTASEKLHPSIFLDLLSLSSSTVSNEATDSLKANPKDFLMIYAFVRAAELNQFKKRDKLEFKETFICKSSWF